MAVGAGSTEYAFWHALFAAASMAVSATGNSLSTPTMADGLYGQNFERLLYFQIQNSSLFSKYNYQGKLRMCFDDFT